MTTATERGYQALAQQIETLESIFKELSLGVLVADSDGRIRFVNPASERILGNGVAEAMPDLENSAYGWYLPDKQTVMLPEQWPLARAIRGEKVSDELIFVRHFQHNAGVWIRVTAWPLLDSSGSVAGGVVVFHDCTQNRRAVQTIELLSRAVEQTADGVIVTDPQGIIQYVNPAFEATHGVQPRRS